MVAILQALTFERFCGDPRPINLQKRYYMIIDIFRQLSVNLEPFLIAYLMSGSIYVTMEVFLDTTSHWSMFLAGGLAFTICRFYIGLPYVLMAVLMALTIVIIELGFGLVVNKYHTIWDYRKYKWNIKGQVCLRFFLLWIVAMPPLILWLDQVLPQWY